MINFISATLFGWPAILITAILTVAGLLRSDHRFLIAAAILALPFSWLLSGFPIIRSPVFLLPLLLFGSGYLIYRGREMWAWLLAVPYFMTIWLLINAVAAQ